MLIEHMAFVLVRITEDSERQQRFSSTGLARLTKEDYLGNWSLESLIFSEVKAFEMSFNEAPALPVLIIKTIHWLCFEQLFL